MHTPTEVRSYEASQIAYPVGPNKESYYLCSWMQQNIETQAFTCKHQVVKNWASSTKAEVLFEGTAKECLEHIARVVEGEEWIKEGPFNYVYPKATAQ